MANFQFTDYFVRDVLRRRPYLTKEMCIRVVQNTIIAGNTATGNNVTPDVSGSFTSNGNNIIGKTDGSTGFSNPSDHTGTIAAGLDPMGLQDNGGPTQTVRLLPGSVAINNGNDAAAPARDQRGYVRNGVSDIGAFEFGGTIPVTLGNMSTRGFVQTGDNVLIGGIIISGNGPKLVLLRALGPTLGQPPYNVPNVLQDPFLDLRDVNGNRLAANDNWKDSQQSQIAATPYAPPNDSESAILTTLAPGNYTAILSGVNDTTGNALVEVYSLP